MTEMAENNKANVKEPAGAAVDMVEMAGGLDAGRPAEPEPKERQVWKAPHIRDGLETGVVKVRHLKKQLQVIKKKEIKEKDVTIVGAIYPNRKLDMRDESKLVYSAKLLEDLPAEGGIELEGEAVQSGREAASANLPSATEPDGPMALEPAIAALDASDSKVTNGFGSLFSVRDRWVFTRKVGYIPTNVKNCYVRVVKFNIVLLIILLALLGGIIAGAIILHTPGFTPEDLTMDANQTNPWDASQAAPTSKDTITVSGVDAIKVDSTHTTWPLENSDVNTSYFKYTVTSNGNTLFESDWIEPGKAVPFNVYDAFNGQAGTYTMTIHIDTRDMNSHVEQNGAKYDVAVTIY